MSTLGDKVGEIFVSSFVARKKNRKVSHRAGGEVRNRFDKYLHDNLLGKCHLVVLMHSRRLTQCQ